MKYVCPQISRSSINSGNLWSVRRVECFLPELLLRILPCVSYLLSGRNSLANLRQCPIFYFHKLSLCCIMITFLRNSYRRVFPRPYFSTSFSRNSSIFHIFLFFFQMYVWNLTNLFFCFWRISRIVTERLRILIHISNYFQLWKIWKPRSPIRMSLRTAVPFRVQNHSNSDIFFPKTGLQC